MELHNRNAFIGRWAMLVLVSVVLLVSIWVGSLTHHRGLVRTDSSYYLRQAAFFVEGLGVNSLGDVEPAPFTLWPLGYPVAIAGAAKLTGLSVFWAAKVVNSMAALLVVLLLVRALPQTGMVASLALLSGGMIATFSSTYSEGVFILAMLAAALALARVIAADSSRAAIALAICIGVAFTVRYVGIVLLGPVLIAGIWVYALRRYRTARLLAGSWVGAAMFVGGYLALNLYISRALLQNDGPAIGEPVCLLVRNRQDLCCGGELRLPLRSQSEKPSPTCGVRRCPRPHFHSECPDRGSSPTQVVVSESD